MLYVCLLLPSVFVKIRISSQVEIMSDIVVTVQSDDQIEQQFILLKQLMNHSFGIWCLIAQVDFKTR